MIYRIDDKLAREQAQWFVIGLVLFAATIILLRDYRVLERYRYTIAAVGIGLLLLPRLPGIGQQVNGAYLGVKVGPLTFQPAEFAKIAIVVFLASYLRDTRQLLVIGARRFAGITIPPLKHFGPLLVVWGAAMVMLFFIQDLGSSLMFFGGFLAVLYVATNRFSFVVVGLALFAVGAWVLYHARPTITDRVDAWLHPFGRALRPGRAAATRSRSRVFAQADGGLFGTGLRAGAARTVGDSPLLPAAQTDLIYSVIVNELGLIGACAVLCIYLLVVAARLQDRDAGARRVLQAAGDRLTAVFALQVFVIVGGVTA